MDNNKMMENYIDMLERENDELKGVLMDMEEGSNVHLKENKRLQAVNNDWDELIHHLRSEKKEMYNTMNDEINELHTEIKELKVENKRLIKENNTLYDGDVLNEEIKELKAEINNHLEYNEKLYNELNELKAEIKELKQELNKTKCGGVNQ